MFLFSSCFNSCFKKKKKYTYEFIHTDPTTTTSEAQRVKNKSANKPSISADERERVINEINTLSAAIDILNDTDKGLEKKLAAYKYIVGEPMATTRLRTALDKGNCTKKEISEVVNNILKQKVSKINECLSNYNNAHGIDVECLADKQVTIKQATFIGACQKGMWPPKFKDVRKSFSVGVGNVLGEALGEVYAPLTFVVGSFMKEENIKNTAKSSTKYQKKNNFKGSFVSGLLDGMHSRFTGKTCILGTVFNFFCCCCGRKASKVNYNKIKTEYVQKQASLQFKS